MPNILGWPALPAALLILALAGCGGGDPAATPSGTPTPTAAPAPRAQALAVGVGGAPPRAEVEPLAAIAVPDVNELGLLDRTGPNASTWPQLTQANRKTQLRQLGKALFWDMQAGGDGLQACASCHFQAGSDPRIRHALNPGHKSGDSVTDLAPLNARLTVANYAGSANGKANSGFAVSQAALQSLGATSDAADGTPGLPPSGKPAAASDLNDVAGSQGVRPGRWLGLSGQRVELAQLATGDELFGFVFTTPEPGMPGTTRRVTPRNAPSVLNAVYHLRNFWDGRADMFFNGVNNLGFRDPDAMVKTWASGALGAERLLVPFSSLASQAVGPLLSDFEMIYSGRAHRDLGRKLLSSGVVPLAGQAVATDDSVLGSLVASGGRGLGQSYAQMIRDTFHPRFWSDGNGGDVCLDANGAFVATAAAGACPSGTAYTLMQWNFALFFGLAVQSYEATLVTPQSMVDLVAGGIATGVVVNGTKRVDVKDVALPGCIALVAKDGSASQQDVATQLCTAHYAKFIHPGATSGTESATAPNPVPAGSPIGGCATPPSCTVPADRLPAGQATLKNVSVGLTRFFSGSTSCADCHFNPEFTGATVSTMTGFGAQMPALPLGQTRRELVQRAVMERMFTANGAIAVYDTGFYNVGVRPTPEDRSLGDAIDGVPLSLSKLFEVVAGGDATGLDPARIGAVNSTTVPLAKIPLLPSDLRPRPFPFSVGCSADVTNSLAQCSFKMVAGERILRHGAFKAPSLRNVKFTGPYMHNGSKMTLRQVLEFYKTGGHFGALNRNNLDKGMQTFSLSAADESALVELLETGLTDWRVAYQQGPFDHPELCVSHGHDAATGRTRVAGLPAVGRGGNTLPLATFQELLDGRVVDQRANTLRNGCTVPGVSDNTSGEGNLLIDLPPSSGTATSP